MSSDVIASLDPSTSDEELGAVDNVGLREVKVSAQLAVCRIVHCSYDRARYKAENEVW